MRWDYGANRANADSTTSDMLLTSLLRGRPMRLALVIVVGWLALATAALAEGVQAQCGAMQGIGFYADQGLATGANAGWHEDAISGGETLIRVDTDSGEVDVRFKDATGIWQSVIDQGGAATLYSVQSGTPSAFAVLVAYPGNVEVYTLAEVQGGYARLIHTQARSIATFTNGRLMVGDCVVTAF